jgi:hypothetical protein
MSHAETKFVNQMVSQVGTKQISKDDPHYELLDMLATYLAEETSNHIIANELRKRLI